MLDNLSELEEIDLYKTGFRYQKFNNNKCINRCRAFSSRLFRKHFPMHEQLLWNNTQTTNIYLSFFSYNDMIQCLSFYIKYINLLLPSHNNMVQYPPTYATNHHDESCSTEKTYERSEHYPLKSVRSQPRFSFVF